jgi:hypothetical protein
MEDLMVSKTPPAHHLKIPNTKIFPGKVNVIDIIFNTR